MLNTLKLTEGETSENIREWFWANELSNRHGRGKRIITANVKERLFLTTKFELTFLEQCSLEIGLFLKQGIFFNPEFNSCFSIKHVPFCISMLNKNWTMLSDLKRLDLNNTVETAYSTVIFFTTKSQLPEIQSLLGTEQHSK